MALMFGRFDIQSELSKSDTALIYKAMDLKADQTVALKTQSLKPLGDRADAFVDTLIVEGESARHLASQNIVALYGAGEIDGQFCAAMEYIQGNSIGTMLARNEGFSIWDLIDITRQVGAGLEHAASLGATHYSLEPAKIMVQWDGMVKILGYGISNMGLIEAESGNGLGRLMPYCSPELIRGEAIDLRSNLFTLGTILYEMATGRKAFDAADAVALVGQVQNEMPPSPATVSAKIHPGVSALIMKALAKDPAERYQSARELVDDLEKCKENSKKAAPPAKKAAPVPDVVVSSAERAAAARKFVGAEKSTVKAGPPTPPVSPVATKPVASKTASPAENRAAAAVAGTVAGAGATHESTHVSKSNPAIHFSINSPAHSAINRAAGSNSKSDSTSNSDSGARLISDLAARVSESQAARGPMLTAATEPGRERYSPRVAVEPLMSDPLMTDPLMSEAGAGSSGRSFSELEELPPLQETAFAPSIPEPAEPPHPAAQSYPRKEEKPRIQPREVAERAVKEIATVPPRLMLYSILGAVGLILVLAIAIFSHVRSEDDGSTAAPQPTKAARPSSTSSSEPSSTQPHAPTSARGPDREAGSANYGSATGAYSPPSRKTPLEHSTGACSGPCTGRHPGGGVDRLQSAGRTVSGRWERRSFVGHAI